ncbi:hypothetical protein VOLCADRAFT_91888 [Volvox carteri f. nagariensis]|uniref:Uncharacterized protein n=1 Tax=Volvox carteri f. nagariensis TaxID=3068 RepID=D8TY79_VOLCA|nr:uncharacterized protein VOLCADRAFT_91888 [Volvox carteri f. nagariensis]EFJ47599.1 hypothetical protein VOLCADRAFT_91888 [Volvox carteri f. nagariensis]|eukprot:XP_002951423.1 hypothetical protein VOLCADRAFT_91888 [Volvox carteri f. nagariensis]
MYQGVTTTSTTVITLWQKGVIPGNLSDLIKYFVRRQLTPCFSPIAYRPPHFRLPLVSTSIVHVRIASNVEAAVSTQLQLITSGANVIFVHPSVVRDGSAGTTELSYAFQLTFPQQPIDLIRSIASSDLRLLIEPQNPLWAFYVRYTVLFHMSPRDTQLDRSDAIALAGGVGSCCNTTARQWPYGRVVNTCNRLAPPGDPSTFITGFCNRPEVLCSPSGRLLKLVLEDPLLNCSAGLNLRFEGDMGGRLASLANLGSLAWLDLSYTNLGSPRLMRPGGLAAVLAQPQLMWVMLPGVRLTGPLAAITTTTTTTTTAAGGGGGGGGGGRTACDVLAPAGRRVLVLSDNQLTGEVPDCLATHGSLEELRLDGNNLAQSAGLPSDWSAAGTLLDLDISSNPSLEGPLVRLPPSLARLNASWTALGGPLPAPLPASLLALDLKSAQLSGPLDDPAVSTPDSLPPALRILLLDNNLLSGSLSPTLPTNLIYLNCAGNQLSGPLLSGAAMWPASIMLLDLSINRFSGSLPAALARLPNLTLLNLSGNQLTGSVEPFLDQLSINNTLLYLDLSFNLFSGTLPASLDRLAVFDSNKFRTISRRLDISYNRFKGVVPSVMYEELFYLPCFDDNSGGGGAGDGSTGRFDGAGDDAGSCRYNLGDWLARDAPVSCRSMLPASLRNLTWEQRLTADLALTSSPYGYQEGGVGTVTASSGGVYGGSMGDDVAIVGGYYTIGASSIRSAGPLSAAEKQSTPAVVVFIPSPPSPGGGLVRSCPGSSFTRLWFVFPPGALSPSLCLALVPGRDRWHIATLVLAALTSCAVVLVAAWVGLAWASRALATRRMRREEVRRREERISWRVPGEAPRGGEPQRQQQQAEQEQGGQQQQQDGALGPGTGGGSGGGGGGGGGGDDRGDNTGHVGLMLAVAPGDDAALAVELDGVFGQQPPAATVAAATAPTSETAPVAVAAASTAAQEPRTAAVPTPAHPPRAPCPDASRSPEERLWPF